MRLGIGPTSSVGRTLITASKIDGVVQLRVEDDGRGGISAAGNFWVGAGHVFVSFGNNHGYLSHSMYVPVAEKAWKGFVSHLYEDGRLGSIQPVGERPDAFRPTSSSVYGVGAFLLSGSELDQFATQQD